MVTGPLSLLSLSMSRSARSSDCAHPSPSSACARHRCYYYCTSERTPSQQRGWVWWCIESRAGGGGGGRRPSHRQDVVGRESRCVVGGRMWDRAAGSGGNGTREGRGGVGRLSTAMAARRCALAACSARRRGPVAALARGGHSLEGSRGRAAGVYLCRLIGPPLASHCRALSGRRQWGAP